VAATAEITHARRLSRLERQARVGILRNPNEPPRPPPRKTALMGRWLSLRSGRRPSADRIEGAVQSVVEQMGGEVGQPAPQAALRLDPDGQLAGIDIATLMASVDGLGKQPPARAAFASDMRPDAPPVVAAPPAAAPRRPPQNDEPPAPVIALPPPRPPIRPRRPLPVGRLVAAGVVLALVLLVVLPAALSL